MFSRGAGATKHVARRVPESACPVTARTCQHQDSPDAVTNRVDRVSHVTSVRWLECCSVLRQHRAHDGDGGGADALRYVATLKGRDHSTPAPAIRHRREPLRELRDVLDLEREFAEWITGETIEPRGDHH